MSLLAWYPLIKHANNQGLDGTNLTNMGSVAYSAGGKLGNAATFTGSATKCLHRAYFSSLTNNFTWACWFKNTTANTSSQFILSQGRDYSQFGFNIIIVNGSLRILYGTSTTLTVATCSANTWYHIAVTVDNSGIKAYLNGVLKATGTYVAPNYTQSSSRFVIGKMSYSYSTTTNYFPFYGQVCDVRIYNHVISMRELKDICRGLVLHYPLRNNKVLSKNTIEYDCSGNGYNGSRNGSITCGTDSGRSQYCYTLGNTSAYVTTPTIATSGFANSYTISYWSKISDMTGKMAFGFSDGNRLNLYPTGSAFCCNTGDGANNPFQNSGTNVAFSSYNGSWHHYAITGDGSVTTLYIDGVKVGTAKTYKGITGTKIYLSGWDTSTSYTWSGGSLSDFRIYATCLSAADILELAKTAGYIDKRGSFSSYDYLEQNSQANKITKKGIQYITTLQEASETCKVYKTNLLKSAHFYEI